MAPPYEPLLKVGNTAYWPQPYSVDPLPNGLRYGLIPVGILATFSVGATLTWISFISYRLIKAKLHQSSFLGYNQYVLLVLNLLIADLQQSAAFLFSFHWVRLGRIMAPTRPCFGKQHLRTPWITLTLFINASAQAWLLHSGDVSSGFFVLAIAIHTFWTAVRGKPISHKVFASWVLFIWIFTYFLTGIGLYFHGNKYFVRAGAWCWISVAYETERLALHYIWVFLVQFATVLIYVAIFIILRKKTRELFDKVQQDHSSNTTSILAINRITKLMVLYPCVYVLLTLPLCAGRMWSYAHNGSPYSNAYACVAGAMITSCGWADSLLYTLTRRRLLRDTMPGGSTGRSLDRGITYTQTITVEGVRAPENSDTKEHVNAAFAHDLEQGRPRSHNASAEPMLGRRSVQNGKAIGLRALVEDDRLEEQRAESIQHTDSIDEAHADIPIGWVRHRI